MPMYNKIILVLLWFLILPAPGVSWAKSAGHEAKEIDAYCTKMRGIKDCIRPICIKDGKNVCVQQGRFSAYQPNSAVFQVNEHDDNAIEVNYSFRYLISSPDCTGKGADPCSEYDHRLENFLTYTGKFDFYMNTRPSSPVVNRTSNPAWHLRKYCGDNAYHLEWLDIALEHKSNGQTVSADVIDPSTGKYKAEEAYQAGDRAYIDSISRSTNYISLEGKFHFSVGSFTNNKLYVKLFAHYWNEESDVHWGQYANQNVNISDFERIRTILNVKLNNATRYDEEAELGIEWTVGDKGLATDSADVWLRWPWDTNLPLIGPSHFPFILRVHFGPLNELSNYSESERSIGFGLAFWH